MHENDYTGVYCILIITVTETENHGLLLLCFIYVCHFTLIHAALGRNKSKMMITHLW